MKNSNAIGNGAGVEPWYAEGASSSNHAFRDPKGKQPTATDTLDASSEVERARAVRLVARLPAPQALTLPILRTMPDTILTNIQQQMTFEEGINLSLTCHDLHRVAHEDLSLHGIAQALQRLPERGWEATWATLQQYAAVWPRVTEVSLQSKKLTDAHLVQLIGFLERECPNLTRLELNTCWGLTCLPSLTGLTQLQTLRLYWCENVTHLPCLDALTQLRTLELSMCRKLVELPSLDALTQLQTLRLYYCENYTRTRLPSLDALTQLRTLELRNCYKLGKLPRLDALTQLQTLRLDCCINLTCLPCLDALTQLQTLSLFVCKNLTRLPCLDALTQLQMLDLTGCEKLAQLPCLDALTQPRQFNLIFPDKRGYKGAFQNGKPHGKGVMDLAE